MSDDAPAIPLFGDAYLADTRHLSLEEHGAYLQLMMIAWRSPNCALPDDDARLARMLGVTAGRWSKLKSAVMEFWSHGPNGWTQKRLSKERAYVSEKSAKNSRAAKARWDSQPIEKAQAEECERMSERNAPPPPPPPLTSQAEACSVDASPAKPPRATRIPPNWEPAPLPPSVKTLTDQWPPGRLERELEGFRDYWTTRVRDAARSDWDKTWHNRIRDQHDRIVRTNNGNRQPASDSDELTNPMVRAVVRRARRAAEAGEGAGIRFSADR